MKVGAEDIEKDESKRAGAPSTTYKLIRPFSSAKCTVIAHTMDINNKTDPGHEPTIEVYNPYEYAIPTPVNNPVNIGGLPPASTMAYYDTANGQYWALPPYKPGFPVKGVKQCEARGGGSPEYVGRPGEWATGCPEAQGGRDYPFETPLIFKCGLAASGPGEDAECGGIAVEGLRVRSSDGFHVIPELLCAKSIDFGVGFKLIASKTGPEGTGCDWRVEAIGGGGVGGELISVVTDIECVGSAFNVSKRTIIAGANCPDGQYWDTALQKCVVS